MCSDSKWKCILRRASKGFVGELQTGNAKAMVDTVVNKARSKVCKRTIRPPLCLEAIPTGVSNNWCHLQRAGMTRRCSSKFLPPRCCGGSKRVTRTKKTSIQVYKHLETRKQKVIPSMLPIKFRVITTRSFILYIEDAVDLASNAHFSWDHQNGLYFAMHYGARERLASFHDKQEAYPILLGLCSQTWTGYYSTRACKTFSLS